MKVPFAIPDCGNEEIDEVIAVIKSGWLTTASRCTQFEKDFAEFVGAKHALAVNSATAALHLGLEALGVKAGDRVLVPTFTFTATAEVVRYLRADPVFVDCDRETFCITKDTVSEAISNNVLRVTNNSLKAIIPVHFGGHPCDMDGIMEIAQSSPVRSSGPTGQAKLKVLEDAAHALPAFCRCSKLKAEGLKQESQSKGRRIVGSIGDVTCFSFYANKTMTTGEGGMLCTDDDEIAKRVKVMRLHGINRDVWDRFSTGASWEYDVIAPGFKYNMPDINAALGIHQLKKVESFRDKRQRIAEIYYEELKDIPGLALPKLHCAMEDHSWYIFMVLIDPEKTTNSMDRNQFITEMTKQQIGTSVHYKPLHLMTYYKKRYDLKPDDFPNANRIFKQCVSLPMFSAMSDEQLEYVIASIKKILL
jgi:dTDP-4-amino-4,6-dideoxygalactose transaminase